MSWVPHLRDGFILTKVGNLRPGEYSRKRGSTHCQSWSGPNVLANHSSRKSNPASTKCIRLYPNLIKKKQDQNPKGAAKR